VPYNSTSGIWTATTGAETATAGQTVASATWDQINSDYRTGLTTLGQGMVPVLSSTSPSRVDIYSTPGQTANFGASAGVDIATFTLSLPTSVSWYRVNSMRIWAAAGNLNGTTVSLFTAAAGGGTTVIGSTSTTVTSSVSNTPGNFQFMIPASGSTTAFSSSQLFLHITTSLSISSANATVSVLYEPLF